MTRDEDAIRDLLPRLLAGCQVPIRELPYTSAFDALYAEFTGSSGWTESQHEFWTRLLHFEESGRSSPMDANPVQTRPEPSEPALEPLEDLNGEAPRDDAQMTLWDHDEQVQAVSPLQPWASPPPPTASHESVKRRQELLAELAGSRLATIEQRVAHVLQRYPETRDSDVSLLIRYWTTFQADVIEKWDRLDLSILHDLESSATITRSRRIIQHDLGLFAAAPEVKDRRDALQLEMNEYLALQRPLESDIRFYLDETGNEGGKRYIGIAGICIMNWRQYAKYGAALTQWRSEQGWPETIHFADTGTELQPRALALLSELARRRPGLLFVGYALGARGHTYEAMLALFIQLITDAVRHMADIKCLETPRTLTVVKEAEMGFDSFYLPMLRRSLADQLAREFSDRVALREVVALPKGREVLLECADLVAGAMQRRALCGGRNPKDVLAEAAFNVAGFEDPRDNGIVYKAYR